MSTTTSKLGLIKPELSDSADITAMNHNWDRIDEMTAEDVGARPSNWTPTASDVGAVQRDIFWYNPSTHSKLLTYIWSLIDKGHTSGVIQINGSETAPSDIPTSVTDKIGVYYICEFQKHGYGYVEVVLSGDGVMLSYRNRLMQGGDGWLTDWVESFNFNGYLPRSGGTLTGNYFGVADHYGYVYANGDETKIGAHNTQEKSPTNERALTIRTSAKTNLAEAFYFNDKVNGTTKDYLIYGEHNKPSGSYTGNGSATSRTINIGGIGFAVLVRSNYGAVIVTPNDSFSTMSTTSGISRIPAGEAYCDGSANIYLQTANAALNANGTTYYWNVL